MDDNKFYYVLLGVAIALLVVAFFMMFQTPKTSNVQQNVVSTAGSLDECATPPGQDTVTWREHLSHHPDKYAKCFK